jgi:WxcM-like, C-terminal
MSTAQSRGIEPPQVMPLPQVTDERGNLTFIEGGVHVGFEIERIYYLYDVPGGAERGGHAHKTLRQLLIALSGSFDVHIDNGRERQSFHLNRAYSGLYIPPMNWREIDNFSGGSICLALASARFDESDYIRDYEEYQRVAMNRFEE